jgi:hypothetical protein
MSDREYGHRFCDGSTGPDESRDAALDTARGFKPGFVEVVYRDGPDDPWQRDPEQPHTADERMDELARFAKAMGDLAGWRGQKLLEFGLASTPTSWPLTEHSITYEWGTRTRMPDGSLEEQCLAGPGHGTGEAFARKRMAMENWPHHRALIRRPVVRGRWENVEKKGEDA